jgi:hypothetical protein
MNQQPFGHRSPAKAPSRPPLPAMTKFSRPAAAPSPAEPAEASVDDEIREWKKGRGFHFPLKLLALVASISFGVASFALPEGVNNWLQYPLYALSALSLYLGFRKPAAEKAPEGRPLGF